MKYSYLDQGDERLLELADMPTGNGIAIAMRTTGYAHDSDEIVELAIVGLDGRALFERKVRPQNIEEWSASEASGGIAPADVAEQPELFQFEDEIIQLFEKADIVACAHLPFARALIEASWISLPAYEGFDVIEQFRLAHCSQDYPTEPASAVALDDITRYYGIPTLPEASSGGGLAAEARAVASCYKALVAEHCAKRDEKGQAYWDERDRRLAEEAAGDAQATEAMRLREKRLNQMNGLLWVAGALIFISLIIQLAQRGGDAGFMVVAGAVAVFCFIRAVVNFRK